MMSKKKRVGERIKNVVSTMMDRVMNNVLVKDPFPVSVTCDIFST